MSDAVEDPISLSFIDCISCGLAAALFMFLVFSAIPRSAALVETQIASAGGLDSGESVLPSLLAGGAASVPVDIRVVFDTGLKADERTGYWAYAGSPITSSTFTAGDGTTVAYLASVRSGPALPTFQLKSIVPGPATTGTISIRAGSGTWTRPFACAGQASAGAVQVIIAFEADELRSDCEL